jgi:hypothetical protein
MLLGNLRDFFGGAVIVLCIQDALDDLVLAVLALEWHAKFQASCGFFFFPVRGFLEAFLAEDLGLATEFFNVLPVVPQFVAVLVVSEAGESGGDLMDLVLFLKRNAVTIFNDFHRRGLASAQWKSGTVEPSGGMVLVGLAGRARLGQFVTRRKAHAVAVVLRSSSEWRLGGSAFGFERYGRNGLTTLQQKWSEAMQREYKRWEQ